MNKNYIYILLAVLALVFMVSCENEEKRTLFPHSTPVIESALVDVSVIYGDSISFTATVSDPITPLSTLSITLITNDKIIGQRTVITRGQNAEVSGKIATEFLSELYENATVEVVMKLTNVEGDVTEHIINTVGKRTYFQTLYMVLENGDIIPLTPQASNPDLYESASNLSLPNKIVCRIAEKITPDNEIDFSGRVWGTRDDEVQMIDITGDFVTVYKERVKTTNQVTFDTHAFLTDIIGEE